MSIGGLFGARAERDHKRLLDLAAKDQELGATMPDPAVVAKMQDPELSYREIIAVALAGYADRPAMGVRDHRIVTDKATGRAQREYLPSYRTISYSQLGEQIEAIASVWQNDPGHSVQPEEFVGLMGFTGAELNAVDLACVYVGAYSVPLQANLPTADMLEILNDVEPSCMVASVENIDIAVDYALQQKTIRSFVIVDLDVRDDDERGAVAQARQRLEKEANGRIAVATFDELTAMGKAYSYRAIPRPKDGNDALSMLCYTSGSTGTPKGALIQEGVCKQFWSEIPAYRPTISVCYAPINHFMGRIQLHNALAQGGIAYFSLKSDLSTLLEDIRLSRPTQLVFMPRFAEMIYHHYLSEKQRLVMAGTPDVEADQIVRKAMKETYLGGRLIFGTIGSSPTAAEVRDFVDSCFDIMVVNAYGSTEQGTGTVAANGAVNWGFVIDYKLKDVPELGYYTTDKPYPRGELVSKTRHQIKGYFKRPDATAAIFDEDGYILSGDIVEQRSRDHIEWLDRRNNVIKLSQAEFVAIGPLESKYLADNPLFQQMYIYGNSHRAFLLAAVVPDVEHASSLLGRTPSEDELRTMVMKQMQVVARLAELKSFEVPRDVLIDLEPFTYENGLLTSARKPSRPNLKKKYGDRLEAMYTEMEKQQQSELATLRSGGDKHSTIERVAGAIKANLGLAQIDPFDPQSYRDLGGDSLGAAGLATLLDEMFEVSVPVGTILDPAGSAARIADLIERSRRGESGLTDFVSIHGEAPSSVNASDLKLDRFFDANTLNAMADAEAPVGDTRTILLTGATGFLGRFLCLDWMEHLATKGGKVICIIRARDDADAMARLREAIGTADDRLVTHFDSLAKDHLEVIAGDLAAPDLGLDDQRIARLTAEVDRVVHCGALVNHVLSYQNLFEPNVLGTAELIRLALTGRKKHFDFISTVGVPMTSQAMKEKDEDADPRIEISSLPLRDAYAMGYSASKWACEVLLREAHDEFGLPVNIFRPDMILAHSGYRGQINVPDMFTRLLMSIVLTGLAPKSFYKLEADGQTSRTHYDGLPGDFVSASIQQIAASASSGFSNFNVINTNADDGISLDTIVDWVESAGYRIDRIDDHGEWHRRLTEKLNQLPEEQKQKTSINILHSFAAPHDPRPERLQADRYQAAVKDVAVGPEVAGLSEAFIHKYLDDMVALGLIDAQTALAEA